MCGALGPAAGQDDAHLRPLGEGGNQQEEQEGEREEAFHATGVFTYQKS